MSNTHPPSADAPDVVCETGSTKGGSYPELDDRIEALQSALETARQTQNELAALAGELRGSLTDTRLRLNGAEALIKEMRAAAKPPRDTIPVEFDCEIPMPEGDTFSAKLRAYVTRYDDRDAGGGEGWELTEVEIQ